MKKVAKWFLIVVLSICGFLVFAKVYAQVSLNMIEVGFCNNNQKSNELDLVTKAWKKLPICVEFTNTSTSSITINVEFLDSVITADAYKDRACNAWDRPKLQFGNHMFPYTGDLILPPQKTIQKEYIIKYPIGFSWLSHGCLAYYLVWSDVPSDMFTVRFRTVKYLDVLVSDSEAIQAISISQKPIIQKKADEYVVSLWIINNGNIDEKVHVISTLSNVLWFTQEFVFDTTLSSDTWTTFTSPSFILPIYGWPFVLSTKIFYTPQFNFNIDDTKTTSDIYVWGTKNIKNIFFVWTRQFGVIIVIILLLIAWSIKMVHKKKLLPTTVFETPTNK